MAYSSETDYFEEDFGSGSGNSLHTETTEEPKNKVVKKNCERTFYESWKQKFHWLLYENEKQECFVACVKPHGMKVRHYLLCQPKFVQSSVLLKKKNPIFIRLHFQWYQQKKQSVSQFIVSGHTNQIKENKIAIVTFLAKNTPFGGIITEVSKLVRNVLTIPGSSYSAERLFSGLR